MMEVTIQKFIYKGSTKNYLSHYDNLKKFRNTETLCDVQIHTIDKCFFAHKIILAASIPFFEKIFIDNNEEIEEDKVTLPNIKTSNMQLLIDFAYTGRITINKDNVESLLVDSYFLGINELTEKCARFLEGLISTDNVFRLLQLKSIGPCIKLIEKAVKFLLRNFDESQTSSDYLNITFNDLKKIICNVELHVNSDELLFHAILKWVKNDVDERVKHLPELFSVMKYKKVSAEYLLNTVMNNELISGSEECRNIIYKVLLSRIVSEEKRLLIIPVKPSSCMEIYFPTQKSWKLFYSNGKCFEIHGSTVFNNKLYIIGHQGNSLYPWIQMYETQINEWKKIAVMERLLCYPQLVALNNCLYVCGGFNDRNTVDLVEKYCLETNKWEPVAPMNCKRSFFGAQALNGYIYACGGWNGHLRLNSIERFDPENNKWSLLEVSLNSVRSHFGIAVLNDKIYLCGGLNSQEVSSTLEVYDPIKNTCQYLKSMDYKRKNLALIAYMDKLWAIGGSNEEEDYATVQVYDPEINSWNKIMSHLNDFIVCGGVIPINSNLLSTWLK